MDRITRKELKHDRFVEEVGHTVEFLGEHRQQAIRIGAAVLAVILIVVAFFWWRRHEQSVRQAELASVLEIQDANVGPERPGAGQTFATEEEKRKAAQKAFADLAAKRSGTDEGSIAQYYLGVTAADSGDLAAAEKHFRAVVDEGDRSYASMASLSLAEIYRSQGKVADAEKLLRALMDRPSDLVSKEQAQLTLGQLLIKSKPDEARKLLEPLRTSRNAISRAAITAVGELNASQGK